MKSQSKVKGILVFFLFMLLIGVMGCFSTDIPITENNKILSSDVEEMQNSLKLHGSVLVIVGLKGNEFTSPEYQENITKKQEEVKKIQNKVLFTLTEYDIKPVERLEFIPFFSADITRSGLEKLLKNDDVVSIRLEHLYNLQ